MITHLEETSLRAWPSVETEEYDGWILRFAEGYTKRTKRANSVNPLYGSAIDLFEKIAYCEKYADHGLPAVFKLTLESTSQGLENVLAEQGYDRLDEPSYGCCPWKRRYPGGGHRSVSPCV